MHTAFPLFVSVILSSTCFEQKVYHQEVISVHAAYVYKVKYVIFLN